MDHGTNVGFIDSHAERRRGDDEVEAVIAPTIQDPTTTFGLGVASEHIDRTIASGDQCVMNLASPILFGGVDDGGPWEPVDDFEQHSLALPIGRVPARE